MNYTEWSQEREGFLNFFSDHSYASVPSFPLIPNNDDSLLFINSSMAPFKQNICGSQQLDKDICTIQRCFRIDDLNRVGDDRHLTFFEMLGVLSQNKDLRSVTSDVFNFLLLPGNFQINQLYAAAHESDNRSLNALVDAGFPRDQIELFDKHDHIYHYWNFGVPGPAGYGLTILVDTGYHREDHQCNIFSRCGRFKQLLNIIYIDGYHDAEKRRTALDTPTIDVGGGLERFLYLKTGKSPYELFPLNLFCNETKNALGSSDERTIRIIADHTRSALNLIAEGVNPANKLRHYVSRKLIRRAITFGHLAKGSEGFLTGLIQQLLGNDDLLRGIPFNLERTINIFYKEEKAMSNILIRSEKIISKYFDQPDYKDKSKLMQFLWSTHGIPTEISEVILNG